MSSNPQSTGIGAQSCCWDLNCVSVHADMQHAKSSDVRPASLLFFICSRDSGLVKKLAQMSVTIDYTSIHL